MVFLNHKIRNIHPRSYLKYFLFFILGITLTLSMGTIWANWTPPPAAPPTCDPATTPGCNTPINVSSIDQTKTGNLTLQNLWLNAVGNEGNIYRTNIIQGYNDLLLYSNSTKNLQIYLEGNPVVINNDAGTGNVGIGTATPTAKLEVAGQIKMTGGVPGAGKILTSDAAGLASWQAAAGGGYWTQSGSNLYPNDLGWNVGIGTTSPAQKLHVAGVGYITDGIRLDSDRKISFQGSGDPGNNFALFGSGGETVLNTPANGIITFKVGNSEKMRIGKNGQGFLAVAIDKDPADSWTAFQVNGAVEVKTQKSYQEGGGASYFLYNTTNGFYWQMTHLAAASGGDISWMTCGYPAAGVCSQRVVITKDSNVGIGILPPAVPAQKLHVAGAAYITDGIRLNNNQTISFQGSGAPGNNFALYGSGGETVLNAPANGVVTFKVGSSEKMRIASNGDVGIGTSGPAQKLHVAGVGFFQEGVRLNSDKKISFLGSGDPGNNFALWGSGGETVLNAPANGVVTFKVGNAEKMRIASNGNVTGVYGNYHVASDIRLKKDVVTIPNALEKVLALRGVNFKWKDPNQGDELQMGMIAQEAEKVVPEVVHTADDEIGTKAVEYQYLTGLLIEAVKEQNTEIKALEQRIKVLEEK